LAAVKLLWAKFHFFLVGLEIETELGTLTVEVQE